MPISCAVVCKSGKLCLSFIDGNDLQAAIQLLDGLLPALHERLPIPLQGELGVGVAHDRTAVGFVPLEQSGEGAPAHPKGDVGDDLPITRFGPSGNMPA